LRIVEEADQCAEHGQIGALLRREGLHSLQLATWRRLRDEGGLQALKAKKRGRNAG
jgi:transposase